MEEMKLEAERYVVNTQSLILCHGIPGNNVSDAYYTVSSFLGSYFRVLVFLN